MKQMKATTPTADPELITTEQWAGRNYKGDYLEKRVQKIPRKGGVRTRPIKLRNGGTRRLMIQIRQSLNLRRRGWDYADNLAKKVSRGKYERVEDLTKKQMQEVENILISKGRA